MRTPSTPARRLVGFALGPALVAVGVLALLPVRESVTVASPALVLILPGIVAGFVGGRLAGAFTAAVAALVLDLVYIEPYGTLDVHVTDDLVALAVFVAVAVSVAALVQVASDRRRAAEQRAAEIVALSEEKERFRREQERLSVEKQALEQIEDARRALLRSVSHDLRTPLATIQAITSDLRDGTAYDPATRDELLDLVGDEAERLDRLVANLLSMSRIEAGALHPDVQAVALDELVDDRARRLRRVLRDVRVDSRIPPETPLVDADYTLLDQVVTNLIENAARHTPPGGVIHIEARTTGAMVEVAVTDEGRGVPTTDRARLFEPFWRGDDSRSSGLGLAICKAIVEAHGGEISIADVTEGTGARFAFTVPVHHATMAASPEPAP
ncbi:MAG: sensor histidine kinase [Acidimicrobiales bacterium]